MKLDPKQRNRLVGFVAFVCACTAGIGYANYRIKLREQGSESGKAIREKLKTLERDPFKWTITSAPGPITERVMRAEWAHVLPARVDVMSLGQSDADHMSGTFFKEPSHFYNGFVSNSYFAYQWEVFDEVSKNGSTPKIVLWTVRSGNFAEVHREPQYEERPDDPVWWAGAPFFNGANTMPPWYKDVPSLLSLAQTEFTFRTLLTDFRARKQNVAIGTDNGQSYVLLPADQASISHRWLSDGSRVYPKEVSGKLVPRGQPFPEETRGDRKLNESSVVMLDAYLGRFAAVGTKVVLYTPPLSALAIEDKTQWKLFAEFDRRVREISERRGVDFCDMTTVGAQMGCTVDDYYDELHISRHCNERALHEIVSGCAPRVGPELRAMVTDAVIAGPPPFGTH